MFSWVATAGLAQGRGGRVSCGHVWHGFSLAGISRFNVLGKTRTLTAASNGWAAGRLFTESWNRSHCVLVSIEGEKRQSPYTPFVNPGQERLILEVLREVYVRVFFTDADPVSCRKARGPVRSQHRGFLWSV